MAEGDASCFALGIPEHLHSNQRNPDPVFDPSEHLYRRYQGCPGKPPLEAFSTKRMSVNRGEFSKGPQDVLYSSTMNAHYLDWAVARFTVQDLREGEWRHPDQEIIYRLDVVHRPEPCIYPHSEVVVTANGEEVGRVKPTTVKLKIRTYLQEKACRQASN